MATSTMTTQYLDDSGEPITASSDVKLPAGYALLSTNKTHSTPKKSVKDLKKQADAMKPADITENPKGEGLYEMYGKTGQGDALGQLKIPYSRVQEYLSSGGTFMGGTGAQERYSKDKEGEGKPVSWYQSIVQSPKLAPVPNEDPAKPIGNVERAAARTILSTPAYVKQLLTAAQSMHEGSVVGGDEVANLLNPFQVPKQLIDQWKEDAKTDPKMATDNLVGSIIGLGVVGEVTHGAMNKVGGGAGALREKFNPVTEAPVRERTNVLHRNGAGEVRQAKGQAPSVWLSPVAWKSLMGELYPHENPAETHGFNLPANNDLLKFATEHKPETPNPDFNQVQELLAKAHSGAGEGGIAIGKTRPSLQQNVNVMRDELNHTWQRSLTGKVNDHLSTESFSDLHKSIPKGMADHLAENGYDEESHPEMVTETAAKLMDGRPERFGVSNDEAVDFLDKYFKEVTAKHGAKSLEELHHVRGIAADAKTRAIAEHAGRTGAGQDNGAVSGVAAGRQGSAMEGVPAAGGDAAFNRDKDKPTWYLKSERLIGDKMKGPQSAEDVHKMLISGGIKPEEMQWTGLDEFLKSKGKDKVTPEEIREHLANNNLQIEEVTKGAKHVFPPQDVQDEAKARLDKADSDLRAATRLMGTPEYDRLTKEHDDAYNAMINTVPGWGIPEEGKTTKYESYVLPGGTNYQEKLITAPSLGEYSESKELTSFRDKMDKKYDGSPYGKLSPEEQAELTRLTAANDAARPAVNYQSSHWEEPNILAHTRFNDRTGPNGEKLLHVEEVQSDWHQKGRDKGYQNNPEVTSAQQELSDAKQAMDKAHARAEAALRASGDIDTPVGERNKFYREYQDINKEAGEQRQKMYDAQDKLDKISKGKVPDAPFKKTWHEMALRRMVRHAVDNGYDGVSWTGGEDQADRYSLAKQVNSINYTSDGKLIAYGKDGDYKDFGMVPEDKLSDYIGKEAARKLLEQPNAEKHQELGVYPGDRVLSGLDLKVGGEGMKGFYDKIVPDYLNKFGKKFGAKVAPIDFDVSDPHAANKRGITDSITEDPRYGKMDLFATVDSNGRWTGISGDPEAMMMPGEELVHVASKDGTLSNAVKELEKGGRTKKTVQYLPITPEMRNSVGQEGVPLFSKTIIKEERPNAQETQYKRDDLQRKSNELVRDLDRLDKENDIWAKISLDFSKYSREERDQAWDEKKKVRDEWWDKQTQQRQVENELRKIENPKIGELREDSSGRKTLWLSKDAMWVVQYATSPGIGNVFSQLQGVSFEAKDMPTLVKRIDLHFGKNSKQADIVPQVKNLLMEAGNQAGKEGVTIVGAKGRGLSETAKTAREEMNHAWQRETSADGAVGSHLKPDTFEGLNNNIPTGAKEYLSKHKYADNPVNNVVETAAKLMSGAGKELNVSPAEEAYWLHDYFQAVIDEHGPEAFNTLNRIMGVAKQLKEEALSGRENKFKLSKRTEDQGTMGSESEGGSEGDSGGDSNPSGQANQVVDRESPDEDTPSATGQKDVDENTNKEVKEEESPEPVAMGSLGASLAAVIPVAGGTQLSSAPVMVPVVPVPTKQVLPLHKIKEMAAGLNPSHNKISSVRDLMRMAKSRMVP